MELKQVFLKSTFFSYLYITIYLLIGILTTPMLLNYFGENYFALIMIVNTVILFLNSIRFGLPESLAVLLPKNSNLSFRFSVIKTTFKLLLKISLLVVMIFYVVDYFISDWRFILGDVYTLNRENILNTFYILIFFAIIKIPLELSLYIFTGHNQVYLEKLYKTFNLISYFLVILFVISNDLEIVSYAILAGISDLLISFIAFVHMSLKYGIFKNNNVPSSVSEKYLLSNSFSFFQLIIIQTTIWYAGVFIVSHLLSLETVTIYTITMKIYIYLFYILTIVNSVLAPIYGINFASQSWKILTKLLNMSITILPIFSGLIWFSSLYLMEDIIRLWTGSPNNFIGSNFLIFMGAFFYLIAYVNSYTTFLYSIGKFKELLIIRYRELLINLFFSIVLSYYLGVSGLALALALSMLLVSSRKLPHIISKSTNNKITINFSFQKQHFYYLLAPSVLVAYSLSFLTENSIIRLSLFIIHTIIYLSISWYLLSNKLKYIIMTFFQHKRSGE